MFREPDEVIAEEAAAKLDRAAATQRSAIRRQATVRPGRQARERRREVERSADRYNERRHDPQMELMELTSGRDHARHADLHIAQLEAELERLRNIRLRQRMRPDQSSRASLRDAADLMRQSRDMFGDDEGNVNVSTRAPSPVRRLPRPTRESNLRFEVGQSRSVSPRRLRMLSPPSSSGSGRHLPHGPLLEDPGNLTPGFAPALGPFRDSHREDEIPTPPPETWEGSYPPLRRVGHLSPRPVSRVDGLGDRRRSPSPENEEETWANLLTTMDDGSTTAATSFASDYNTRSRSSQNTTTSFGEIGQVDDSCDLDLPLGITEADVHHIRQMHRRMQRNEPDGPVMTGEQGLREHQREQQTRRYRRAELGMFQSILARMQRREDVPDEWWAAVGLTPDVVRGAQG